MATPRSGHSGRGSGAGLVSFGGVRRMSAIEPNTVSPDAAAAPVNPSLLPPISGNWDPATQWSSGAVAGVNDVAVAAKPGTYTITSSQDVTISAFNAAAGVTLEIANNSTFSAGVSSRRHIAGGSVVVDAGSTLMTD